MERVEEGATFVSPESRLGSFHGRPLEEQCTPLEKVEYIASSRAQVGLP